MFYFLTYLQPTHYFRLHRSILGSVFPEVINLSTELINAVPIDTSYQSLKAREYDQSWRLIQMGYIGNAKTYDSFEKVPLLDEYRFIRKNFHSAWVLYVLLIRLCSLNHPFKEIVAFWYNRNVKRVNEHLQPIAYSEYVGFTSKLIQQNPLVSVIIPTLNRYEYLFDVLKDLEKQIYTNFEVIIVDQSTPFQEAFYKQFKLEIKLIYQEEKALWLARNTAIKKSIGEYILLSEDDVRFKDDWILQHLKTMDFFDCDVSAGVFYPKGATIPTSSNHFKIANQFATGNAALRKNVFKKIGLFDRQFEKQRMGDGEFGLRIFLVGFKSISNPLAKCVDVKARNGGLREMGSWDGFRPKKWFSPRPIPSVLYLFRKYHGNKAAKLALLKTVPSSIMPYRFKRNSYMMLLGVCMSILLLPMVFFQVFKSWKLASKKLKEGAIIEELKG